MSYIRLEKDDDGIVELIFDQQGKAVNVMGEEYARAMPQALDELEAMVDEITGVYVRSGKPGQFFAGGDITMMLEMDLDPSAEERESIFRGLLEAKEPLARLERLGVPIAVGINGPALGGGYEIALACHHRIALEDRRVKIGLPEAMLGLMPGAGGVVRMVRLLGMQEALTLISQGKQLDAQRALDRGLVHALAADEEEMAERAKAWIRANPEAKQPWEEPGYSIPGGGPEDPANQGLTYFGPVNVMVQTRGNMPAQQVIMAAVIDTARVDYATAHVIEARYFQRLLLDQVARNMMTTFFVQMNELDAGASRPDGIEKTEVKKLGILGAGVMGAGIAFAAAKVGIEVVLKDLNQDNADRGKAYAATACEKSRRIDEDQAEQILARIHPTALVSDLADCDLVIEAVFEDREVKAGVLAALDRVCPPGCVIASNTSSIPIGELAEDLAPARRRRFVGMHFASPVSRIAFLELIPGEETDPATVEFADAIGRDIGKQPTRSADVPGFASNRLLFALLTEAIRLIEEGVATPEDIDATCRLALGHPLGPCRLMDTISNPLVQQVRDILADAYGERFATGPLLDEMVEAGRTGRKAGQGWHRYGDKT